MPAGFPAAFLLFAQAASAAAPQPAAPAATAPKAGERQCAAQPTGANGSEIVICAVKPEGYRLPPDVVEARRLKKQGEAGRPRNPHETYADHSCATVGPMGCRGGPTINLLAAAATAAEMADRLSKGQEIGSMFETEPQSSEYQYYLQAKKEREAKEAAAAAKKVADEMKAKAAVESKPAPTASKTATASH
jgi:hypothetical protein